MKRHFYSDIAKLDNIIHALEKTHMTTSEKAEMLHMAEEIIHHAILDLILTEINEESKKSLLKYMVDDDHEKIWEHLNANIENAGGKIQDKYMEIEKDLLEDIEDILQKGL